MSVYIVEVGLENSNSGIRNIGFTIVETSVSNASPAKGTRRYSRRYSKAEELLYSSSYHSVDSFVALLILTVLQVLLGRSPSDILHDNIALLVKDKSDVYFRNADSGIRYIVHNLSHLVLRQCLTHSDRVTELDPDSRLLCGGKRKPVQGIPGFIAETCNFCKTG